MMRGEEEQSGVQVGRVREMNSAAAGACKALPSGPCIRIQEAGRLHQSQPGFEAEASAGQQPGGAWPAA